MKQENKGYALIIVLIAITIIALIFFSNGGFLDRFMGSDNNENQKKATGIQLQDLQENFDDYNKRIQNELNNN